MLINVYLQMMLLCHVEKTTLTKEKSPQKKQKSKIRLEVIILKRNIKLFYLKLDLCKVVNLPLCYSC